MSSEDLRTNYDFCGWATKNDIKCSDGRTIKHNAFAECDGTEVPLVWNHGHRDLEDVLGHTLLENREEGVYAYGKFNDSENGVLAHKAVLNGDIKALSIYANELKQNGGDVIHGVIKEVSLCLAGANKGAYIERVLAHSEDGEPPVLLDDEVIIHSGLDIELYHAADEAKKSEQEESKVADENKASDKSEKTVQDVIDTMNDEQKKVMMALIAEALDEEPKKKESEGGDKDMKHNVFESEKQDEKANVLSHAEELEIIADAKKGGSLKEAVLAHTDNYGITNIGYFWENDYHTLDKEPGFIKRETDWVAGVIGGAKHVPFSRIRTINANITEDEARAKGYIKGNQKKTEVFPLLRRTTDPCTIYKMQKLDRDDILDITDFNVVSWLKAEMRLMLNEEVARAMLVGDGREAGTEDKISEDHIRPIWTDADLYTIKELMEFSSSATAADKAKAFIKKVIKSRKNYKGSGNPALYTTEDLLTEMLLLEDGMGRPLYDSEEKLRTTLRVSKIVTVPVMEALTRTLTSGTHSGDTVNLEGILVNLVDYALGNDKGGEVNMFDDFDIDFNQYKYLMETRLSGALTKPYSAIVIESYQGE